MPKEINVKAVNESNLIPSFILDKARNFNKTKTKRLMNVDSQVIENFQKGKADKHKPIRTTRSCVIIAEFVGYKFEIHNGKGYITRTVDVDMIGRKFGEFAETRKEVKHPEKKKVVDAKKKKGK